MSLKAYKHARSRNLMTLSLCTLSEAFFSDCALGPWNMYYSTVQLLRMEGCWRSLIIPCWVMERTGCSGLNKSSQNVFQSQGQNNDPAFAIVQSRVCHFHHAPCKSAEGSGKRRIGIPMQKWRRRQVTNLTLRLLLSRSFHVREANFVLGLVVELIFRGSLLNVRLF